MTAKPMFSLLAVLILAAAGLAAFLLANEGSFIYFPEARYAAMPQEFGLRAEPLDIASGQGVLLRGWWIHGDGSRALLYYHGNGGNISHRLERVKLLVDALGVDVVLVDYRGYGQSNGRPNEAGLYADGAAIYGAARERGFAAEKIVLFGESLGSAVAIEIALSHPCRAVILEAPFLSVPAMARAIYPFLPSFLIRTRFDNGSKVVRLAVPKLIALAEHDDVVPPAQTRRLYEIAAPPKELYVIRGAAHNDTYAAGGREYLDAWKKFLETAISSRSGSPAR
jgi:uncharacterized protein